MKAAITVSPFIRLLIIFFLTSQYAFGQTPKIKLYNFQNSTCDHETDPGRLRTRIIKKDLKMGILKIQIAATAYCCVNFLPKATMQNEILDLDFQETGDPCECFCCYEFIYEIEGIKNDKISITFKGKEIELTDEKYKTYPIKYRIINGDTVNYIDKYGLRQGVWVWPQDSLRKTRYLEYADDTPVKLVKVYPNGQIESEVIREKIVVETDDGIYFDYFQNNKLIEYYESGKKKRECYNSKKHFDNDYEKGKCKVWNEEGELIYEGDYRK